HVDPRFTRTSALADMHVPLRAGTDIAFLGGIINYVFEHEAWFEDYVKTFTNGPVILTEDFRDTEDLDGLFSGFDPDKRHYDFHTWLYEGMEVAPASGQRDEQYDDRVGGDDKTKDAGRGEATGSGGTHIGEGEPERDE